MKNYTVKKAIYIKTNVSGFRFSAQLSISGDLNNASNIENIKSCIYDLKKHHPKWASMHNYDYHTEHLIENKENVILEVDCTRVVTQTRYIYDIIIEILYCYFRSFTIDDLNELFGLRKEIMELTFDCSKSEKEELSHMYLGENKSITFISDNVPILEIHNIIVLNTDKEKDFRLN